MRVLTENPYKQERIKRMTRFEDELVDITGCTNILCNSCKKHGVSRCSAVKVVNSFAKFELNWNWVDWRNHRKGKEYYRHDWCKTNELSEDEVAKQGDK